MSLTINGKSRDEIEAALAATFDANDIKKDREGFGSCYLMKRVSFQPTPLAESSKLARLDEIGTV